MKTCDISPQNNNGLIAISFPSFSTGYAVGSNGTVVKTESGGVVATDNPADNASSISLFPNPVSHTLMVQSSAENTLRRLRLYNVNGQFLMEQAIQAAQSSLDFSGQEPNIYYLEISPQSGKSIHKIIKL